MTKKHPVKGILPDFENMVIVSLVGLTYQTCVHPLIYTLFISHCGKVHLHTAPRQYKKINP